MTREELLQIAKPVLFNTEMTVAILEDRKGATRRCIKPQPTSQIATATNGQQIEWWIAARPYRAGDILYVRETWSEWTGGYVYKAWSGPFPQPGKASVMKWHPSIHMPKEAARIFLRVTDVRAERLQDITIEDIRKEGLTSMAVHAGDTEIAYEEWKLLWDSTIKKLDIPLYGWDANPWVWVIEFERIEAE